jgi:HAMP domain-containing protein
MKTGVFISLFTVSVLLACAGEKKCDVQPLNPNGDSELALLMRDMFDDAMRMKLEIMNGQRPQIIKEFEQLHTAEATQPEKVATSMYTTFATNYQNSIQALKNAELGQTSQAFNELVQSCMTCHKAMCPGPIVRIEKLWVEDPFAE